MKTGLVVACCVICFASGCGYPAFTSVMRANYTSDLKLEMKCEQYTTRNTDELNKIINKYYSDGWRLSLLSEYTSTAMTSFPTLICFERPAK